MRSGALVTTQSGHASGSGAVRTRRWDLHRVGAIGQPDRDLVLAVGLEPQHRDVVLGSLALERHPRLVPPPS